MADIKRGATFRAAFEFTAEEWAEIYPHDAITANALQGETRFPLTVTVEAADRMILLGGATDAWEVGTPVEVDLWVTIGAVTIPVPFAHNVRLNVIQGATQ